MIRAWAPITTAGDRARMLTDRAGAFRNEYFRLALRPPHSWIQCVAAHSTTPFICPIQNASLASCDMRSDGMRFSLTALP